MLAALAHASIHITASLYGYLFKETGVAVMRRLGEGIAQTMALLVRMKL